MKILLAEDMGVTRRLLEEALRDLGHDVVAVADGEAAWEAFLRERPPLVVVDWMMPRLSGLELCRRIRGAPDGAQVFVLMATGRGTTQDLADALDGGVDDYIAKPVTPDHLAARVAIAARRMQQEQERRDAVAALARARWLAGIGETALAMQHELNTPLTTLTGLVSLAREAAPHERGELLAQMDDQVRRMARVVHRLATLEAPRTVEPLPGVRMVDLSSAHRPEHG